MEVNFVTDIFVYLSLEQIKLSSALVGEFFYLLEPFILKDEISKRPKIKLPYTSEKISETIYYEYDDDDADAQRDSGIDTSDIRSLTSFKAIVRFLSSLLFYKILIYILYLGSYWWISGGAYHIRK